MSGLLMVRGGAPGLPGAPLVWRSVEEVERRRALVDAAPDVQTGQAGRVADGADRRDGALLVVAVVVLEVAPGQGGIAVDQPGR
jgi:hypothetical protein